MRLLDNTPSWFSDYVNDSNKLLELSEKWANLDIFEAVQDQYIADRFIELSVPHTYLFGRFTVPYYLLNISRCLILNPPAHGNFASSLKDCLGLVKGEICTNNIYERAGDCHAHYYDIKECVSENLILQYTDFEYCDKKNGFWEAAKKSALWSSSLKDYAKATETAGSDMLASFLIMWISEQIIPYTYHSILRNLPSLKKYQKFRTFIEKHIYHDEHDHGPATRFWLNQSSADFENKATSIKLAGSFIETRIDTYRDLK